MKGSRRVNSRKLSISLPAAMAEWLREEAQTVGGSVSEVIRRGLLPA